MANPNMKKFAIKTAAEEKSATSYSYSECYSPQSEAGCP
jgi:hypothetical protein